jgi:hypothetical protein
MKLSSSLTVFSSQVDSADDDNLDPWYAELKK